MRLAICVTTLIGSLLSALGSGFICLCYLLLPLKPHFRHRLIQSLAIADFLNATSNAASGIYILARDRELPEGIACRMNGLVTQITVQATDLSILAIAIVTVWVVTNPGTFGAWSTRKAVLAVCFIWVLPFITGFTALGKDWYHPVSGNWCWIQKKPVYLRYALTHGWRFFVIISVIVMYTYLHFFLRSHYKELRDAAGDLHADAGALTVDLSNSHSADEKYENDENDKRKTHTQKPSHRDPDYGGEVKKVFLMRAYPFFYVILLIPGIANRMVEASGRSSKVTQLLQASTQFVGLANAITYGWNEKILGELRERFGRRPKPSPGSHIV
ncbi:G protein-coupled glucose receptor regulating Gpa2-domain-containing protein [Tuber borchii]|uniref:G protein-coupled glucose receptor regulating Gpa2-domain-containing protein n=1 Tax=Tuber borchii TaxID=42251 RepID=A0A2T6ZEW8_TUBBO|nr:G protein-coupled glucose receptor regulating Gpa2-domain-containing protein [Tuber borchii]